MKLLYENTKSCSTQVETKIDELKKVLVLHKSALNGNAQPSYGGSMG